MGYENEGGIYSANKIQLGHKLIKYGVVLLLLGLITGFAIPAMENPRMGLSSHLEGTLNGMLLIIFGLVFPKLQLSGTPLKWAFGFAIFGTYTNWFVTLLAGMWGAGSQMMPFASEGHVGTELQEAIISVGLLSLSLSMIAVSVIILWGLKGKLEATSS